MSLERFDRTPELPVSFRGYAREPTDALLRELEAVCRALLAERDELRELAGEAERRLKEAEAELVRYRAEALAVSRALVTAEKIKLDNELDAAAIRAEAQQEAARLVAHAEERARAIVGDAEVRAEQAVTEADDTRERFGSLARELFARVTGPALEQRSGPDVEP